MKSVSVLVLSLLLLDRWLIAPAWSRPVKRYDQTTKMCRILDRGQLDWDSEPWGLGGQKFRQVCKSCHNRQPGHKARFLWVESFMPKGWNRIFAKKRVKCARDGSWDVLSRQDLLLINDYLYRNGDWTYDPNNADTCG